MTSPKSIAVENTVYKVCTACGFQWATRDAFMKDPDLEIIGYQVHFEELSAGLFLFNHSCNGTLSLEANAFFDLYDGPIFSERKTGSDECEGHCLHRLDLDPCPAKCECAFVRDIIQTIKNHHP